MNRRFYQLNRDIHLYLGLFISPFVLVFAVSVFFLVHTWRPGMPSQAPVTRVIRDWAVPENLGSLSGRPLIDALRPGLDKAGVRGEIGFVRHIVNEGRLVIPVSIPGRETTVSVVIATHEATILTRETGLADALITLHKSPGQHGPGIRMNWYYMKAWRWLADATVYLVILVTVSGVLLWQVLRTEQTVGLVMLITGALCFFGMAYALSH